jgi:hypothetical protein
MRGRNGGWERRKKEKKDGKGPRLNKNSKHGWHDSFIHEQCTSAVHSYPQEFNSCVQSKMR